MEEAKVRRSNLAPDEEVGTGKLGVLLSLTIAKTIVANLAAPADTIQNDFRLRISSLCLSSGSTSLVV